MYATGRGPKKHFLYAQDEAYKEACLRAQSYETTSINPLFIYAYVGDSKDVTVCINTIKPLKTPICMLYVRTSKFATIYAIV